jgi:glyoxylase-like metal-dependent hydrolase (beta-lactamase superfamily II)
MASTFSGLKPMTDGQELPGGAKRVNDGYTSAYLLPMGEKEVALVDCGNDVEAKTIKAELQKRGLGVDAVKAIFLTHGHADHTGGCKQFPGAQVMVGDGDQGLVEGTAAAKGPLPSVMGATPKLAIKGARAVKEGEVIEVGTLKVRVFVIPGHTGGSAAYLANGALYVGDSLAFNGDDTVRPAPWIFSDDGKENVASLKRLGKLLGPEAAEVKAIVPAHSGSVDSLKPLVDYAGT